MEMNEIRFKFECCLPFGFVEVIATPEGSGILIIDEKSSDEISFEALDLHDREKIEDWVSYYKDMLKFSKNEPIWHEESAKSYVDWLNRGCP